MKTALLVTLRLVFQGSHKTHQQLMDELRTVAVYPIRTGHDDEGVRMVNNTSIAAISSAEVESVVHVPVLPPPSNLAANAYKKYRNGGSLTNSECVEGTKHFQQMAAMLIKSGPEFHIAFIEANRVAMRLEEFAQARGLIK